MPPLLRRLACRLAVLLSSLGLVACGGATAAPDGSTPVDVCLEGEAEGDPRAAALRELVDTAMAERGLRAVIMRVTEGDEEVVTFARGEAMPGVAATTGHYFHNGAVAMTYLAVILLRLSERGVVGLDDPIAEWHPTRPGADRVTLRMLATNTSGYRDYLGNAAFVDALYENPFRVRTDEELIEYGLADPPWYEPGEGWSYAHTNYVLLGQALSRAAERPLSDLIRDEVLTPLGLSETHIQSSAEMPSPVLHHYTSERGPLEDATFWSPSWQLPTGAIMSTNICDLATSARGVGRGTLVSPASQEELVAPYVVGRSGPTATCPAEVCRAFTEDWYFGLAVQVARPWLLQTPSFAGFSGLHAHFPEADLAIAIVVSGPEGTNFARELFVEATRLLTPEDVPAL